ncbi:hypothetical protein [uncultured Thiodictyon sp.]|uniref:hypothetical protein n=1 Tax=uncultured Thiodictyon sp. TaxID=1846217 RepID=UPI0025F80704|nr:hypothetical protein [uncultured Thiodictyon sp.]
MDVRVWGLQDLLSGYLRRVMGIANDVAAESEANVIARLRALPWVRPGNGEQLEPVANPIPAGLPGELLLSELLLKDRE